MTIWQAFLIVAGFIGRLLILVGAILVVYGFVKGYSDDASFCKITLAFYTLGVVLTGVMCR